LTDFNLLRQINVAQMIICIQDTLTKRVLTLDQGGVDIFEFNFARSFILILPSYLYLRHKQLPIGVPLGLRTKLLVRIVIGTFTYLGMCYGF